ncbi:MAG: acetylxylan esterase [Bacteroidales bacterium]|nr:acetylxylan esterase [Bacteroidales bacterium]
MRTFLSFFVWLFILHPVSAQFVPNLDESKVVSYTLPEVLQLNNGKKIKSTSVWEKKRRPELLEIFSSQMYGRTPQQKLNAEHKVLAEEDNELGGTARSRQILFTFSNGGKSHTMQMLIYYPKNTLEKVPVFLVFGYGNESITENENVIPSPATQKRLEQNMGGLRRGRAKSRWPLSEIISQGFAIATVNISDLYADRKGMEAQEQSIMTIFDDYETTKDNPDFWRALGVWAWGMSRAVDYFETDDRIDVKKIAVMGHSRIGKASLWAGAQDPRFAIVFANNSGCGGDKLARRNYGESIGRITSVFPYWFCENYKSYDGRENEMPWDQHLLVALMAPRPVYIGSAEEDTWADPKGQFLGGSNAGPAYELYGKKGLGTDVMPPLHSPIMNDVGYHIRAGKHDVTDYDWQCFLTFAKKHFQMK